MQRQPEIMSPAGYWPQLRAAIEAGASSVYFGLKHFTARAKVGFSLEELPEVMRTLHARGVRGYLTFNTLVFEHELPEACRAIAEIARAGVDALIVQDVAILRLARAIAPGLELHASTQMSITDANGVRFAQSLGADRVTLARELSLDEVRSIHDATACELETFVHGALCVAYSGQCFSSEAWGGRSANRGQCAQACRLPYEMIVDGELEPLADARYLLSPGDLYTLEQVPRIVEAGVSALKIEGRYKDSDYVALTTRAYREALDAALAKQEVSVSPARRLELEQVYSRGLGAHFVNGINHQTVVNGRAPRHRGVLLGRVRDVVQEKQGGVVVIEPAQSHRIAPCKPGDGLVFDAADWRSPGEPEEGGRVYEVRTRPGGNLELAFGNGVLTFDRIRRGDLVWRTQDPAIAKAAQPYLDAVQPVHRQPVTVRVVAREGAALRSEWIVGEQMVAVESPAALSRATRQQLSEDMLREQFGRLGGTAYVLAGLTFHSEGSPFAPVSVLNQMRREAVEKMTRLQSTRPAIEVNDPAGVLRALRPEVGDVLPDGPALHLLVRTPGQLDAALECRPASITLDYLDLYGLRPSLERVKAAGLNARVAAPRILKPGEARIVEFLRSLHCPILVRSTGVLQALTAARHASLIGDFSLNAANSITAAEYFRRSIDRLTPTHDLNAAQIADLARATDAEKIEAIAYQHLPVFHTEHCVFCRFLSTGTSYKDCGRPCEKHQVQLRDQQGRSHPLLADVGCRNTVFGAEAQEASGHLPLWLDAGIRHFRLEFAHETGEQVRAVAELFAGALLGILTPAQLNRELRKIAPGGVTQGSLFVTKDYLTLPILQ